MFTNQIYLIHMYKPDLALDNQLWLICHNTKHNYKCLFHYSKFFILEKMLPSDETCEQTSTNKYSTGSLAQWVECSPMIESYQRL